MKAEDRIVELLSESLIKQDQMIDQLKQVNKRLDSLEKRVGRLEKEQNITNVLLRQHSRDIVKIAELLDNNVPKFNQVVEFELFDEGVKKGVIREVK